MIVGSAVSFTGRSAVRNISRYGVMKISAIRYAPPISAIFFTPGRPRGALGAEGARSRRAVGEEVVTRCHASTSLFHLLTFRKAKTITITSAKFTTDRAADSPMFWRLRIHMNTVVVEVS